jgi:hypothetical protein
MSTGTCPSSDTITLNSVAMNGRNGFQAITFRWLTNVVRVRVGTTPGRGCRMQAHGVLPAPTDADSIMTRTSGRAGTLPALPLHDLTAAPAYVPHGCVGGALAASPLRLMASCGSATW